MILLTSLKDVRMDNRIFHPIPILKLTTGSGMGKESGALLDNLKQESIVNGFRVTINSRELWSLHKAKNYLLNVLAMSLSGFLQVEDELLCNCLLYKIGWNIRTAIFEAAGPGLSVILWLSAYSSSLGLLSAQSLRARPLLLFVGHFIYLLFHLMATTVNQRLFHTLDFQCRVLYVCC